MSLIAKNMTGMRGALSENRSKGSVLVNFIADTS